MGTPKFAADILASLLECPWIDVPCVYTQPDRPAGRGKKLIPSPVKNLACAHNIPVRQPLSLKKEPAEQDFLAGLKPDYLVVAAYGMILPQTVLDLPRYAPVNVHTSLLPAYRGSAPVQRALMDGVERTGVSIMRMEAGLDTGPVYASTSVATAGETSGSLLDRMAGLAVPLLLSVLRDIPEGHCVPVEQTGTSSYAAKISKQDGWIDFHRPARLVDCHIRAVTPDPGAHVTLSLEQGPVTVVLEEVCCTENETGAEAGSVLARKGQLVLVCAEGALQVVRLKPQGKKSMDVASFLNGQRLAGSSLSRAGHIVPVGAE